MFKEHPILKRYANYMVGRPLYPKFETPRGASAHPSKATSWEGGNILTADVTARGSLASKIASTRAHASGLSPEWLEKNHMAGSHSERHTGAEVSTHLG